MSNGPFGISRGYTPMSDVEQEVVARLVEAGDLRVHLLGWGVVHQPRVIFGDLRVSLNFRVNFDRPPVPVPVHYFDLELRTGSGLLLFKERQSVVYNGNPVQIAAGMFIDMVWDIAITSMDPKVVKAIKPGATGLTSRFQDRDTGEITLLGNQKVSARDKRQIQHLRAAEAASRKDDANQVAKAEKLEEALIATGKLKKK